MPSPAQPPSRKKIRQIERAHWGTFLFSFDLLCEFGGSRDQLNKTKYLIVLFIDFP